MPVLWVAPPPDVASDDLLSFHHQSQEARANSHDSHDAAAITACMGKGPWNWKITSLTEENKCSKISLDMIWTEAQDGTIRAAAPRVAAGKWNLSELVQQAKSAFNHGDGWPCHTLNSAVGGYNWWSVQTQKPEVLQSNNWSRTKGLENCATCGGQLHINYQATERNRSLRTGPLTDYQATGRGWQVKQQLDLAEKKGQELGGKMTTSQ